VVSTIKSDLLTGTKYLLVQVCDHRVKLQKDYVVALDLVGAGMGEIVLVAQGSSARQTPMTFEKPIDGVVAGIVDLVEEEGITVFRK
jgi:microcompartment protein CcmK/EutM